MLLVLGSPAASAQDLYDPSVLRTFRLNFQDANWQARLRANYASQTDILADLEVDGILYPSVGVRIRGNTSYTGLPPGSEKFSLKIEMDLVNPSQDLYGYDTINLNNSFRDPTFTRELIYNNYVAQFIPNARANNALMVLNGQNWGVYINVQQGDKSMLRRYFDDEDGLRIACPNIPNGPGLSYNGPNASGYTSYEIQEAGGLADPIGALIAVTQSLSQEPLISWQNIDTRFAIDPSIWSVVLENFLTDDDSYINKGCDFATYRDPIDGRMHLLQRDANETFTQSNWEITRNFTAANKPVLSRVLAVPQLRQRYMAHYRSALRDMNWAYFGPRFAAQRALIDAAVQADPKKLYTYSAFQSNFTSTVNLGSGFSGGNIVGLEQFINQRASFLAGNAELNAQGPTINNAQASSTAPAPGQSVWISAQVLPAGNPIAAVELHYRPSITGVYLRTPMRDDGLSGDGLAGDGVYGALLPVNGVSGQRVSYYAAATAGNALQSVSFLPRLAERGPNRIEYALSQGPGMRITEWMYTGVSGEFVEFTNRSDQAIDLTGWSMDDDRGLPGGFSLSALGVVPPGASVVVTDSVEATFRSAWSLAPQVKILGQLGVTSGNNLGRNDRIDLFNATGTLVDRLAYGDQNIAGTIRTQNRSGHAPCSALGLNTVSAWRLAALSDAFGSYTASSGDIGAPGRFLPVGPGCGLTTLLVNGFEAP